MVDLVFSLFIFRTNPSSHGTRTSFKMNTKNISYDLHFDLRRMRNLVNFSVRCVLKEMYTIFAKKIFFKYIYDDKNDEMYNKNKKKNSLLLYKFRIHFFKDQINYEY